MEVESLKIGDRLAYDDGCKQLHFLVKAGPFKPSYSEYALSPPDDRFYYRVHAYEKNMRAVKLVVDDIENHCHVMNDDEWFRLMVAG